MNKDLTFDGVPLWMQRFCIKTHKLLIPEWTLLIRKSKTHIYPNDEDIDAEVNPLLNYLDAEIIFGPKVIDNSDGHRTIIHEMLHLFFKNSVFRSEKAEEQAIVKLSKILEGLT